MSKIRRTIRMMKVMRMLTMIQVGTKNKSSSFFSKAPRDLLPSSCHA